MPVQVSLPPTVRIVEVGPRDGLQNESRTLDAASKAALIDTLAETGLRNIEAGSFVSPRRVPQMADSDVVIASLQRRPGVRYTALTPNLKGFERALACGVDEVAVFAAASESFSQKNINCSIADSLKRFSAVMDAARQHNMPVRAYVSCAAGCPYQGAVASSQVRDVAAELLAMGCYEISLGDTIGVGTPGQIRALVEDTAKAVPIDRLALHLHDTYGQALANAYAGLQSGISVFDSAVAGLGGCPFAKGATGNVASEDLLYMLQGLGIETGVSLPQLVAAGNAISALLGRPNQSRVARAMSTASAVETA